jgi:hypothetical protein
MSADIRVNRAEIMDWRKKQFVDDILPTLVFQQSAQVRGEGVALVAGSHRISPGSVLLITKLSIAAGSAGLWWCITRQTGTLYPSEARGTIELGYFESKGMDMRLGNVKEPVLTVGPGSMWLRFVTIGSAVNYGFAIEGVEQ